METSLFALPHCPKCQGTGRVQTGIGITDWAVCPCAIVGQRRAAAERLIANRFSGRAAQMTFSNFQTGDKAKNEQALQVARNFVEHYDQASTKGWIVGFWGPPSCGKTHLAVAMGQAVIKRYLARPLLLNVPRMLRAERERFSSDRDSPIDQAMRADLLILDDIGAQYERTDGSEKVSWVAEQLYTILDERYMACRPTIITSNLSPSDLERRLAGESGKRVLARIERAQVTPMLEIVPVPGAGQVNEADARLLFS